MAGVTHTTVATGTDSADGKISKNAWNEAHTVGLTDVADIGRTKLVVKSDCFFQASTNIHEGGITAVVSGTGANASGGSPEVRHPGIIFLASGSTTTGRAAMASPAVLVLTNGSIRFGCIVRLTTLSDVTNTFILKNGIGITATGDGGDDEVEFRYTDGTNSGKWQAICRNAAAETAVDTGITVDTGWHTLEFVINDAATSVEFFIDGSSVATITTNIPSGATSLRYVPCAIFKALGTTGRSVNLDAYWYMHEFNPSR